MMKKVLVILVAVALAAGFVSTAYAGTITLGSFGNQGPALAGVDNSALGYVGFTAAPPLPGAIGSGNTYNLTSGISPWANALAGSYWVSEDPNSTVGLGSVPPNGYYEYTTTFDATPGTYVGNLGIYADDTAQVYLNGTLIAAFDTNVANGPCAQDHNGPTCVGNAFQTNFMANLLASGNVLTIIDWQSGDSAAGIDFAGTLTSTPEPGSLLLLGSGLASLAGFLYRKAKGTV
jgi:hypothetical protein